MLIRDAVEVFLEAQPKKPNELIAMMELRLHALRTPELREGWLAVHQSICSSVSDLLQIALDRVGARLRHAQRRRWSNCSAPSTRTPSA